MLEVRRDLDLAEEPFGPDDGTQFRLQDLQGHLPVVLEVLRQVHGGHTALAEHSLDLVAAFQGDVQAGGGVLGHRHPPHPLLQHLEEVLDEDQLGRGLVALAYVGANHQEPLIVRRDVVEVPARINEVSRWHGEQRLRREHLTRVGIELCCHQITRKLSQP